VLEAGDPIVVPSRQRAVALRLSHAAAQLASGRTAWATPSISATGAWLQECGARLRGAGADLPRTLGVHEEWLLWGEAAAELTAGAALLLPESIADGLARAAQLAADYRIPTAGIGADPGNEARWLAAAIEHVERRAAALGALPRHRLWSALAAADPVALRGRPVWLVGHGPLTPALRHLVAAWQARGMSFAAAPSGDVHDGDDAGEARERAGSVRVEQASDPLADLRCAAEWCLARLRADPTARLLLVVPDLGRRRIHLDRVLRETLEPASCFERAVAPQAFGFEGGAPLAEYALPAAALDLLALLNRPVTVRTAVAVLEARFWSEASRPGRARAARWLRARQAGDLDLADVLRALAAACAGDPHCEAIATCLRDARQRLPATRLDAAGWAAEFAVALETLGWPGRGIADTAGQQALDGWRALLQQFADLAGALGACTAVRAADVLAGMARREPFAPVGADYPVLVTASIDDPVVRYDGIRVCGLQAEVWPPAARLDPYVPWALQRRAAIPAATPAGCLQRAREAMAAWRRSAAEVCLSSARRDDDTELAPSPLLAAWPARAVDPAVPTLVERLRTLAPAALSPWTDPRGAPWPGGRALPKGVRALDLQNRCPFRAYAEIRLGAEEPRVPQPGVSGIERGEYLHRVLELTWAGIGDSTALAGLDDARRRQQVEGAAEAALALFARPGRPAVDERSVARERERAVEVVLGLLELEARRAPFRVLGREWELETRVAGATIRLRIDRVDAYVDGRLAILDYKSGAARPLDWLGERADPVQLFTYALALQAAQAGPIAALGNVHLVRRGKVFSAMSEIDALLPQAKVAFDWAPLLRQWGAQVERLAADFLRGEARVDPLADACKRCHLPGACRRAELGVGGASGG
jgi:ATP-dependent helicase/nuclease subunit B